MKRNWKTLFVLLLALAVLFPALNNAEADVEPITISTK